MPVLELATIAVASGAPHTRGNLPRARPSLPILAFFLCSGQDSASAGSNKCYFPPVNGGSLFDRSGIKIRSSRKITNA